MAFTLPPESIVRRVILLKQPNNIIQYVNKYDQNVQHTALFGPLANHESEVKLANNFSHCLVFTLGEGNHRWSKKKIIDSQHIEFDYHPRIVVPSPVLQKPVLRHIFLAKFKNGAPVADLVSGYAGLTKKIKQMRAFEWGKVANVPGKETLASGYEYAFMTTFENSDARDTYLAHEEHEKFANIIFGYLEKIVVMDFVESPISSRL